MQKRGAYYNEIDPYCVQWLRNLIKAGHIAPGDVDERDIRDVCPNDLRGYAQCHFFAGIGVWSYALRRAGWADDREAWTGSCPCQPFSVAGLGGGLDDERHLWPFFHHLIAQRHPAVVVGEQVASKGADPWIDLVHTDMEALGYAFGAVPFPSAGVGAPHIRDRDYWVADASGSGLAQRKRDGRIQREAVGASPGEATDGNCVACGLADANGGNASAEREQRGRQQRQFAQDGGVVRVADTNVQRAGVNAEKVHERESESRGVRNSCRLADADGGQFDGTHREIHTRGITPDRSIATSRLAVADGRQQPGLTVVRGVECDREDSGRAQSGGEFEPRSEDDRPGPTNGYWRTADWLGCTDGKWRPVEPGTFPLAHGATSRVGRLRAYGNAVNAEAAIAFIETVMECMP